MTTYIPTKKGTDPTSQTGQAPASNRRGGQDAVSPGSDDVVQRNQALIASFVSAQRQNVACNVIDHHEAHFTGPEVDVHYSNHLGAETIRVDPKVQPQSETVPQPDQPTSAPNHLVELAKTEIVTPDTPKYLMVLFQQDGIAAFPMTNLSPSGAGSPDFLGRAGLCNWVDEVGEIVKVGQFKLLGTEWIMTALDFTARTSAQHLYLSTNALGDAVPTQADIQSLPLMNTGDPSVVYTTGGAFVTAMDTGLLTLSVGMDLDAGVRVAPYAIANDGTSYYFPEVLGADIFVTQDYKSRLGYRTSSAFLNACATAEDARKGKLPNPDIYCVLVQESNDINTIGGPETQTWDSKIDIILSGENYLTGFLDGVSHYGRNIFGGIPVPTSVKIGQSPQDVEIYDIGANHTVIKPAPAGMDGNNFSNDWPAQTYHYPGGGGADPSDLVDVEAFTISATATSSMPLMAKTDKDHFTSLLFASGPNSAYATKITTDAGPPLTNTTTHVNPCITATVPDATYPPLPGMFGDMGTDIVGCRAYYDTLKSAGEAGPHVKDHAQHIATQLKTTRTPVSGGFSYMATGDFATPEDAPFPAGCNSTSTEDGGGHILAQAACDLHFPYAVGHTGDTFNRFSETSAFGANISFSYTISPTFTTTDPAPSILAHAFPPALKIADHPLAPWYTLITPSKGPGGSDTTTHQVVTPYGIHLGTKSSSFTPWMHVSNGKHVIQAYYVDDEPHAFVDGSPTTAFLGAIADACGCAKTEIVAMYMDITLAKVKAVTGIQQPDYSLSHGPDPGMPDSVIVEPSGG